MSNNPPAALPLPGFRPADDRPAVWGVLNVTPDSFSDGGALGDVAAARDRGLALLADGADALDIGGESTRPDAAPVAEAEEIARVVPVIAALRAATTAPISIDTMKPAVARAAAAVGADIWNDVTALGSAPESPAVAAALGLSVVLMHMQGAPQTMQADPRYADVVAEVIAHLRARIDVAVAAGVAREAILVDPGIGFGKTLAHNLRLLQNLARIGRETGAPVLLGASRKSFIAKIEAARAPGAEARLGGSIAAALAGAAAGVAVVRVHDVRETVQALEVWRAIRDADQVNTTNAG